MPLLDERADRYALEGRDPGNAIGLAQLVDGLVRDHATVAYHHQLLDAEVLAQPLDLGHYGLAVDDIALVHRHGHRAAARIGEQAVVDLQQAPLAVAAIAEFGQRTTTAFEVARSEVVEHQATGAQMP